MAVCVVSVLIQKWNKVKYARDAKHTQRCGAQKKTIRNAAESVFKFLFFHLIYEIKCVSKY